MNPRDLATKLHAQLAATGAVWVEADMLLPADTLLDLYGEDIRARAYVTHDPLRGEMMLRPDFTVPVVKAHMEHGAEPARYCYMGSVFRQQYQNHTQKNEYIQVGYEIFDRHDPLAADAEVFALFTKILAPYNLRAAMGDIGILRAAIAGLTTSQARKDALLRHIWRPKRFRALVARFSGQTPSRPQLLEPDLYANLVHTGLRRHDEVAARVQMIVDDAHTPPLPAQDVALLNAVLNLNAPPQEALAKLTDLAQGSSALTTATENLAQRIKRMDRAGVDLSAVAFEASYGRTSMEYYDGFVFGFYADTQSPAIASGGRYDALTKVLGGGNSIPAVGGVIRPDLLCQMGAVDA